MVRECAVRVMCVIMCGCIFGTSWHGTECVFGLWRRFLYQTPPLRARRSSEICSTLYVSQLWWVDYSYNGGISCYRATGTAETKSWRGNKLVYTLHRDTSLHTCCCTDTIEQAGITRYECRNCSPCFRRPCIARPPARWSNPWFPAPCTTQTQRTRASSLQTRSRT